jgi:hypothetical protein
VVRSQGALPRAIIETAAGISPYPPLRVLAEQEALAFYRVYLPRILFYSQETILFWGVLPPTLGVIIPNRFPCGITLHYVIFYAISPSINARTLPDPYKVMSTAVVETGNSVD